MHRRRFAACLLALAAALPLARLHAADLATVVERRATATSEGVRLAVRVYHPDDERRSRPVVVMSHGWGGTAAMLDSQARAIAAAGYFVAVFDYRGWGDSDGRLILDGGPREPVAGEADRYTAKVREIREVIDPIEQAEDLQNVIHWVVDEPGADATRIPVSYHDSGFPVVTNGQNLTIDTPNDWMRLT
jgi:predicted acyl esterase